MGVERFGDGAEEPTEKVGEDLLKDTGNPGDVGRPEEPTPDNSPREPSERAHVDKEHAESRTRSEYADYIAPPNSPSIDGDSLESNAEDPSSVDAEHNAATRSGQGQTQESHSAQGPEEQRTEERWGEEQSDTGNDSTVSIEAQGGSDDPAMGPARSDGESTSPNDESEETRDDVETDSSLGRETDDDPEPYPDDTLEPSVVGDSDSPPSDASSTREADRDADIGPDLQPSPEPDDERPTEGLPATENPGQDTAEIGEHTGPLTDKEWTEHLTEVRTGLEKAHAEGLATDHKYTIDPDHLRWNRERRQLHREIVETIYARSEHVPCDHSAIIAGGLGGAGKTTILKEQANLDLTKYLMINPDDIKEEMARRSLVPEVEGLSPMESSDLVHEESSAIAKSLARRAYAEGRNLIWDITMSSLESTSNRIKDMRAAGYTTIDGIFVDIPVDTSIKRTEVRHRFDHNEFRAGRGLGGRFVPAEVIRAQADQDWGTLNRRTFEIVKEDCDSWYRYDNSTDDQSATLVQAHGRT
jgi:predicted ABC-type ATPase